MCTVTLFPTGKSNFVLTSNRDESPKRKTLHPEFYIYNKIKLMYPKDERAGGSWIGVSEKQRLICVLNGAFNFHERKDIYRLSRGVVMKDLLIVEDLDKGIAEYDLIDIEPFTMVIVDWSKELRFMELVWDGNKKHFKNLPLTPLIWSSSTLYSDEMKSERKKWFQDFKKKHVLSNKSALEFHSTAGNDNLDYGVIMDRFFVKTTSITQVEKNESDVSMLFNDLITNTSGNLMFKIQDILK